MDNTPINQIYQQPTFENVYLVFNSKQEANNALDIIYSNMIALIDSPDLLNITTGIVVEKDKLTIDQAVEIDSGNRHFPIFGVNAASFKKNTRDGYTTSWSISRQTLQGKWVFQKPDDDLLNNVVGYTIESYDEAWFSEENTDGRTV